MRDINSAILNLKNLSPSLKVSKRGDFLRIVLSKDCIVSVDTIKDILYINGIYNCDIDEDNLIVYIQEMLQDKYEFVLDKTPKLLLRLCVKTKNKGYFLKHTKSLAKKKNLLIFNSKQILFES